MIILNQSISAENIVSKKNEETCVNSSKVVNNPKKVQIGEQLRKVRQACIRILSVSFTKLSTPQTVNDFAN